MVAGANSQQVCQLFVKKKREFAQILQREFYMNSSRYFLDGECIMKLNIDMKKQYANMNWLARHLKCPLELVSDFTKTISIL